MPTVWHHDHSGPLVSIQQETITVDQVYARLVKPVLNLAESTFYIHILYFTREDECPFNDV